MKVLIVSNRDSYQNPFVKTLADGISKTGVDITCSLHDFWHDWSKYDIIHFQWPNLLVAGAPSIECLRDQLQKIKGAKIPMVITLHNLRPHYTANKRVLETYDLVYSMMDCFVHLGSYSFDIFKNEYPCAKHTIIPHHVYNTLYKNVPLKGDAIQHLHLDNTKKYILCFGSFRDDEERELASLVAQSFKQEGYKILAPGFSRIFIRKNLTKVIGECYRYIKRKQKYPDVLFSHATVSDSELPYYYAASDIALIQRKQILNSGNLPMAFMMGKVVVGPNVGNVGRILCETGNPTFVPSDMDSVIEAVEKAIQIKDVMGEKNLIWAKQEFATEIIALKYVTLYKNIKDGCTL